MAVATVIHIDDSQELRGLVQRGISKLDATVQYRGTDCASDAIAWMSAADPSRLLVLLDLDMPDLDGFEVLRLLQDGGLLPRCRVVMFTSSTSDTDRERCMALGATQFCIKPIAWDALLVELRRLLA